MWERRRELQRHTDSWVAAAVAVVAEWWKRRWRRWPRSRKRVINLDRTKPPGDTQSRSYLLERVLLQMTMKMMMRT